MEHESPRNIPQALKERKEPLTPEALRQSALAEFLEYGSMDHWINFIQTIYNGFVDSDPGHSARSLANIQYDYDKLMEFLHTLDKAELLAYNKEVTK